MVGVSEVAGLKEEEIELDLGLCIGVSFRKPEKSKLINGFGVVDQIASEKETQTASLRTNTSPPSLSSPIASSEPENALLDPHTKREIQALRRQEAKRKREEKRSRGGRNEPQIEEQQPAIKKERLVDANVMNVNVNLNLSNGQTNPRYPVQPGQYPYPTPVQFVPYTNGFAYPCVVPCWAPTGGGGFRPFQAHQDLGKNGGDKDTDQNGGVLGKPASLQASPICSSSTVSEHQSAGSHEGGSSETRSHSSQGFPEQQNHLSNGSNSTRKDTSNSFDCNSQDKVAPQKEEPKSGNAEPVSNSNPNPISPPEDSPPPPPPLKEISKMEPIVANPPKPQTPIRQNSNTNALSLPQMPYVSTTGNGPNGKTIHGFLYRYSTKSEISIVCVCHGSTFSPAEFVHHAGGTDVSQPLRHITVIPSAFG